MKLRDVDPVPAFGANAVKAPARRILPSLWRTMDETVELAPGLNVSTEPSGLRRAR